MTDSSHSSDSNIQRVLKLSFVRAIPSCGNCDSSYQIAVTACTEFRDPISDALSSVSLTGELVGEEAIRDGGAKIVLIKKTSERYVYNILFPSIICRFQVSFSASSTNGSVLFIPIISDYIHSINSEVSSMSVPLVSRMLSEYHPYEILQPQSGNMVKMYEEFGSTLGSHTWDTAIILARNLQYLLIRCQLTSMCTAVELGCGSGLVSIALARSGLWKSIVATDKACQMQFLSRNLSLNSCEENVFPEVLEWESERDLNNFHSKYGSPLDLIVAADVLYDSEAARSLFDVIRKLATASKTCILLGQKIRDNKHSMTFDVTTVTDFGAEVIFCEANIVVWRLILRDSSSAS
jgi:predicted nicotinamide N-methyase